MQAAYDELIAFKHAIPAGNSVGHSTITTYPEILKSAETRTNHSFGQFFITDAARPIRPNPQSPIQYICGMTIFLQEVERAILYVSKHISK